MDDIILIELIKNGKYVKKALPHLKKDYFEEIEHQVIFSTIKQHIIKYRKLPTFSSIVVAIQNRNDINENVYNEIIEKINEYKTYNDKNDIEWLVDSTELFCQKKALENAIMKSAEIVETGKNINSVKDLIDKALQVNFNRDIGIEFFSEKDINERWDYYNRKVIKYKTHIKKLNYLTNGGLEPKTLSVFFGDTHSGKCVHADTKIKIRNKISGLIEEIKIKEFHERFESK